MFFHPFVDFRDFPDSQVMLKQLGMGIKLGLRNAVDDPSTNPCLLYTSDAADDP